MNRFSSSEVALAKWAPRLAEDGFTRVGRPGWAARHGRGVLHCVDDCSHAHTTAHRVQEAAERLGLALHLRLHICDAYGLAETFDAEAGGGAAADGAENFQTGGADGAEREEGGEEDDRLLDVLWLDFGAGVGGRLQSFLAAWWPRLRPGGLLLMHSTLTNALTRRWLESMRDKARPPPPDGTAAADGAADGVADGAAPEAAAAEGSEAATASPLGDEFVELSFLEPHKCFQNSFSIFQRRPKGWGEPVHTMYP